MQKEYIGGKIRRVRLERKMTTLQVSKKLNINEELLIKYEKGIYRTPYNVIQKLSEIYNYPIYNFIHD